MFIRDAWPTSEEPARRAHPDRIVPMSPVEISRYATGSTPKSRRDCAQGLLAATSDLDTAGITSRSPIVPTCGLCRRRSWTPRQNRVTGRRGRHNPRGRTRGVRKRTKTSRGWRAKQRTADPRRSLVRASASLQWRRGGSDTIRRSAQSRWHTGPQQEPA